MKVCAIVVTYNPNINEFNKFFKTNKLEVDYSIIVDNSDDKKKQNQILGFKNESDTEVIQLLTNKGIAYAQNIGIDRVKELENFDFVLFLDQDSMLNIGTVNTYKVFYNELSLKYNIAALGIGTTDSDMNSELYMEVNQIISSGTFSPISCFQEIGVFDEDLFIDFVEYDWCWRAKKNKYKIFSINSIKLIHKHGDGKINILGFKMVNPTPIRHYYQYRNLLYMLTTSHVPILWKLKMFFKTIIKTPLYIVILNKKKQRIKFIYSGIRDFILNKKGKFE
ncbi:MAG: hypothetical protein ACEQSQ_01650 [Candidatus Paceibacteria bacterium]|jgi:rhamnosyltransferase